MKVLSKHQALLLHEQVVSQFGGTDGVRDEGLLESALAAPTQTFGGQYLYPTLLQKAAQLGFALVSNHPFLDGNKRTGAHVMLTFLLLNGVELEYTQSELIDITLKIASSQTNAEELSQWNIAHKK